MATILIVDDKRNIIELANLYLTEEGFQVITAADGVTALEKIEQYKPDLVLLDIMLPQMDGWEVCRRVRKSGNNVPIIMLTARAEDVDKVVGLELGADDYVTKPFNPRELIARIKAVLRRYGVGATTLSLVRLGQLEIDRDRREALVLGQALDLRPKEFDLLVSLAENAGMVFNREQLLNRVWGYDYYGDTRTVDVHVAHLRDKLTGSNVAIETVRGIGYKIVVAG
jgi:two-component system alkaline phosphatase synthesis response regulator PhoP/two-component system response regulator ResD